MLKKTIRYRSSFYNKVKIKNIYKITLISNASFDVVDSAMLTFGKRKDSAAFYVQVLYLSKFI